MKKIISILVLTFLFGCSNNESELNQSNNNYDAIFHIENYLFRDGRLYFERVLKVPFESVQVNSEIFKLKNGNYQITDYGIYDITIDISAKYYPSGIFDGSKSCDYLNANSVSLNLNGSKTTIERFDKCDEWKTTSRTFSTTLYEDETVIPSFTALRKWIGVDYADLLIDVKYCTIKIKKVKDL